MSGGERLQCVAQAEVCAECTATAILACSLAFTDWWNVALPGTGPVTALAWLLFQVQKKLGTSNSSKGKAHGLFESVPAHESGTSLSRRRTMSPLAGRPWNSVGIMRAIPGDSGGGGAGFWHVAVRRALLSKRIDDEAASRLSVASAKISTASICSPQRSPPQSAVALCGGVTN